MDIVLVERMLAFGRSKIGKWRYSMEGSRIGTDKTADCSGFVWRVMKEIGCDVSPEVWNTASMYGYALLHSYIEVIPKNEVRVGDLAFWGPKGAASIGAAGHVGIVTWNSKILNCMYSYAGKTGVGVMEIPVKDFGANNQPTWYARIVKPGKKIRVPVVARVSKVDVVRNLVYSADLAGGRDYGEHNALDVRALIKTNKVGKRVKNQVLDVGDYFTLSGSYSVLDTDKKTRGIAIRVGDRVSWITKSVSK
jgi:hypothetical protein